MEAAWFSYTGAVWAIVNEAIFPGRPSFKAEDIPDMSSKVVLVTGATAGIGKETARVLLTKNAKVWITARNQSKGEATVKELKDLTRKVAHLVVVDLANMRSIKAAGEEFNAKETQLNVLFNNAGVMTLPIDMLTEDGYDLQFGTNVLGHFYLTKLLLPALLSTAKSAPDVEFSMIPFFEMGIAWSFIHENLLPGGAKFTAENVPDMSGKVVLVTGATAGIGKETAKVLLSKNAKVWIAVRNESKGNATLKELKELTGKDAHLLLIDLSSLKSVKAAVEEFNAKEKQLDVLFNNAGVLCSPRDMLTEDGYDHQFGTNVLGHFYLTKLLLPTLLSTAKSAPDGIARVVNISSNAHWLADIRYNTLRDSPARRKRGPWNLYGQSKTGNIIFAAELKRRYGDQGIVSTALNPGMIRTEIWKSSSFLAQSFASVVLKDTSYGAVTQLYAGTTPDGASLNGKYLIPWARIGKPRANTQDPEVGRKLWDFLEEQVKNV